MFYFCFSLQKIVKKPKKIIEIGITKEPIDKTLEFAYELADSEFKYYNAFSHNCNHFANKLTNFLCEKNIPFEILNQNYTMGLDLLSEGPAMDQKMFDPNERNMLFNSK